MGEYKRKKKKNSYIPSMFRGGSKNQRQINHYTYADDLSDDSADDEREGFHNHQKYYGGFKKDITVKTSTNTQEIDEFPISIELSKKGSQSSIVTILSLCNTMMGTSLLSIPWAINKAGFAWGIIILILMAGLMFYTSYRILVAVKEMKSSGELLVSTTDILEFSDVCRQYLGRFAEFVAFVSSLLTLIGGMIIYWILVSNFIYKFVTFIFHHVENDVYSHKNHQAGICPTMHKGPHNHTNHTSGNLTDSDLYDVSISGGDQHTDDAMFKRIWDQQATVPLWLVLIIFPLLNFKSAAFFMRFNALGSVTVMYLIVFVARAAYYWGIHVDFSDPTDEFYVYEFKDTFPILTGVAAMAYFNQNSLLAITRNQKNPDKNVRDLLIAFIIVCCIYVCVGTMIYISIIKNKDCIADNFLDNFKDTNVMAFIARIGLFLQIMAVFPQLFFIFRLQFMNAVFGKTWPSLKHVLCLNFLLVTVCVMFAIFLPKIGHIIGFIGALTGFTFAIALPCLVYMKMRYTQGKLTPPIFIVHIILIVLGGANFGAQFFVFGA